MLVSLINTLQNVISWRVRSRTVHRIQSIEMEWLWMNGKRTNFCSSSVGLEHATRVYKAVTQSIPPPRWAEIFSFLFIHNFHLPPPLLSVVISLMYFTISWVIDHVFACFFVCIVFDVIRFVLASFSSVCFYTRSDDDLLIESILSFRLTSVILSKCKYYISLLAWNV